VSDVTSIAVELCAAATCPVGMTSHLQRVGIAVMVPALAAMPASASIPPIQAAPAATAVVERTVHGSGVDLYVRAAGSPHARTTVVTLSGGPGLSSDYMRALAQPLVSRDVRVVTWDPRGTGRSTKPADGNYSMTSYVADLEAVRRSLGAPRIVLLGHSWGGLFAAAYTTAHPDRVQALGLIDAEPADRAADEAGQNLWGDRLDRLIDDGVIPLPLPDVVNDDCSAQLRALSPVYFADPKFVPPAGSLDVTCSDSVGEATRAALTADTYAGIAAGLARYRGPALILFGAADPFGRGWSDVERQQLAQARPQVKTVPHAGHFPWLEQPEPTTAALRAFVHGI
jgi:proline iminopeptidase